MNKATHTLIELVDGKITNAIACQSEVELEDRFADEFLERGIEPCDFVFEDGYFEFEDGVTVMSVTAYFSENKPSGKRNL